MARFLRIGLWSFVALGVVAIALIAGYAARNSSGHTGWEPFTSLILFVPLALVGLIPQIDRAFGHVRTPVRATLERMWNRQ